MFMDERLRKFVQLVDAGNFVKAANELHVSQPALSVAIAKLERELHAQLLVHGVRPLKLTPAGHIAYHAGKEMMVQTNNLKVLLAELAEQQVAVSVGMIDSVADALFGSPENIGDLERHASVSLVVDNSANLLRAVENNQLDLAFVVGKSGYGSMFEVVHQASEVLVLVCHANLRTHVNQSIQAGTLPHFISYNQTSATYRLVAEALQERQIVPAATFYSTSPEVMLRMLLLQKGVAALPYLQVRDYVTGGALALVGQPEPFVIERPIHAVKRRDIVLPKQLAHVARRVGSLLDAKDTLA